MGFVSAAGASPRRKGALARLLAAPLLLGLGLAPNSTESAAANGDTRTLEFTNDHTNESGVFTYMVDGAYDRATLDKLNWFLRDWRLNEPTKMDPKLFDIVWEVYRESGSKQPIDVLSGYRSPQTNALLRRRSRRVAKYSQHMEGKAMDARFEDVDTATIRDIAMRMQAGGVGFYPGAWVHIDSGEVRYWPRMNRNALARIFPDGKTVFIPVDGQPMPGFDQAKAEIEARGGEVVVAQADKPSGGGGGGLFSWLFGAHANAGGADDAEEVSGAEATPALHTGRGVAAAQVPAVTAPADAVAAAQRDPPPQPDADASPTGAQFVAPTPPAKPPELALANAPTPPMRPTELAVATPPGASAGDRDLIAALLARGRLPGVITRGFGAPRGVLALAEVDAPEPPERPAMLARAAALAAPLPPLPPLPQARAVARAAPKSISNETTAAIPARPAGGLRPAPLFAASPLAFNAAAPAKPANPYGDLVTDGFKTDSRPNAMTAVAAP